MITCVATLTVKPGYEKSLEDLLLGLTNQVLAQEPGCRSFHFLKSRETPGNYAVIEKYLDEKALDFHKKTDYLKAAIEKIKTYVSKGPDVVSFTDVDPKTTQVGEDVNSYFHIGIVVEDIEKSIQDFSRILGISFTEPAVFHVKRLEDPHPRPAQVFCTFSKEGPPYYELIQATETGIFSKKNIGKIMYLGVWETDMPSRIKTLEMNGIGIDAKFKATEDGVPFCIVTNPEGPLGIRFEFVDKHAEVPIERWVNTGASPDSVTQ